MQLILIKDQCDAHFVYSMGVSGLRNHPILDEVIQHESIPHAYTNY